MTVCRRGKAAILWLMVVRVDRRRERVGHPDAMCSRHHLLGIALSPAMLVVRARQRSMCVVGVVMGGNLVRVHAPAVVALRRTVMTGVGAGGEGHGFVPRPIAAAGGTVGSTPHGTAGPGSGGSSGAGHGSGARPPPPPPPPYPRSRLRYITVPLVFASALAALWTTELGLSRSGVIPVPAMIAASDKAWSAVVHQLPVTMRPSDIMANPAFSRMAQDHVPAVWLSAVSPITLAINPLTLFIHRSVHVDVIQTIMSSLLLVDCARLFATSPTAIFPAAAAYLIWTLAPPVGAAVSMYRRNRDLVDKVQRDIPEAAGAWNRHVEKVKAALAESNGLGGGGGTRHPLTPEAALALCGKFVDMYMAALAQVAWSREDVDRLTTLLSGADSVIWGSYAFHICEEMFVMGGMTRGTFVRAIAMWAFDLALRFFPDLGLMRVNAKTTVTTTTDPVTGIVTTITTSSGTHITSGAGGGTATTPGSTWGDADAPSSASGGSTGRFDFPRLPVPTSPFPSSDSDEARQMPSGTPFRPGAGEGRVEWEEEEEEEEEPEVDGDRAEGEGRLRRGGAGALTTTTTVNTKLLMRVADEHDHAGGFMVGVVVWALTLGPLRGLWAFRHRARLAAARAGTGGGMGMR